MSQVLGLSVRITQRVAKDSSDTQFSDIYVFKNKQGGMESYFVSFDHQYEKHYDWEANVLGKKIAHEDLEEWIAKAMYVIERSRYHFVEVEIRGFRDATRIDREFKIDNDKSETCNKQFNSIKSILFNYFGDLSKIEKQEKKEKPVPPPRESVDDRTVELIANLNNKVDSLSQAHEDVLSSVSGSSKKSKKRGFFSRLSTK